MKRIRVQNGTKGTTLLAEGRLARTWRERLVGLMGRKELGPGEGLVIRPCESIHTWWMRFPIDVVFLDVEDRVVKVCPNVRIFRLRFGGWNADSVVEGAVGMIERSKTEVGDRIEIAERVVS